MGCTGVRTVNLLRVALVSLVSGTLFVNPASAQGWYLMRPPTVERQSWLEWLKGEKGERKVDLKRSLSEWEQVDSFATLHECEFRRDFNRAFAERVRQSAQDDYQRALATFWCETEGARPRFPRLAGPETGPNARFLLTALGRKMSIVIDNVGYDPASLPSCPSAPAPGADLSHHLRHPLRDLSHLRARRVPLSAGP